MFRAKQWQPSAIKYDNSQQNEITANSVFIKCVIVAVYICQMLLLFSRSTFELVLGPVLAICIIILMFTPYYYIPVAVVFLTTHALGTVILGRISFFVLMGFMLVLRLFIVKFKNNFNLSDIAWMLLGLFNCFHLAVFMYDSIGSEKLTIIVVFTLWMIYMRGDTRSKEEVFPNFWLAFAFAITTNAVVSLLSRSATMYETSDRMGIIGFGSNDPNIAAMVITLGIAILLSSQKTKMWVRITALIILFFSLITTVSISGLIAATFTVLVFSIIMNKNKKNVSALLIILLGALVAVYLFPMLGIMGQKNAAGETVNYLEYFQEKLNDKMSNFAGSDIDNATSGRSELTRMNLEYLFEQSALKQLFGGNHVNPLGINVSHNSFVDIMLRYGYLGFFAVFLLMIYSVLRCMQRTKHTGDCTILLCKLLMIYWSLTLSLFDSNGAVLWFSLVLML